MKKIVSVMLLCVLFICACGKKQDDFYLELNGKKLELNKEFSVESYGQYNDSFESQSCAFGNRDVIYFYDGIEIETYGDDNSKLIVYSIKITSEELKNSEGIGLYDEISNAIKAYGEDYEKDDNRYTFIRNNTSLVFITQNEIITRMEYRITNME